MVDIAPMKKPQAALRRSAGFTMIELMSVLSIMVVAAAVIIAKSEVTVDKAKVDATRVSLMNLRDACTGTPEHPGFLTDCGETPRQIVDLFRYPPCLPSGAFIPYYDPRTRYGWNGPYLLRETGRFPNNFTNGYTPAYGTPNDPGILDAWGRAVIIQHPAGNWSLKTSEQYCRLISAGPDGVINTSITQLSPDINNRSHVGDDIVVYLFRANGP